MEAGQDTRNVLSVSYLVAGVVVRKPVIPWCSEAILVEARVPGDAENVVPEDFKLRVSGLGDYPCQEVARTEGGHLAAKYRVPAVGMDISLVAMFRNKALDSQPAKVPFLSKEDFLAQVRLVLPTLSCQLAGDTVACNTYVSSQCRIPVATCALLSEAGLAPLCQLDPELLLLGEGNAEISRRAIRLSRSQSESTRALISTVLGGIPKKPGMWVAVWNADGAEIGRMSFASCQASAFIRSLHMVPARYLRRDSSGACSVLDGPVKLKRNEMLGPVFGIQSSIPGVAGLLPMTIEAIPKTGDPFPLQVTSVLVTDGLNLLAPGLLDEVEVGRILGFRLVCRKRVLQVCPADPAPAVRITNEGGFAIPVRSGWTRESENQLRLLMDTLAAQADSRGG